MTSKSSFSKGALLVDGLRRNLWCIVLSTLGCFMSLTLPVLMLMQRALEEQKQIAAGLMGRVDAAVFWKRAVESVSLMLGGGNAFLKFIVLALAVVCGITAYSYLHSRQRVDFYHALPVSRTRQFFHRFVVGVLCVIPAYCIALAVTLICTAAMGFGEAIDMAQIAPAIAGMLIIFLLVYALSALAAILCGNTIISLLLLMWILFGPAAAWGLKTGLYASFYNTYASSALDFIQALRLSPVMQFFLLDGFEYVDGGFELARLSAAALLAIYLAAAVLITLLCLFLYRIRKSERAGMALAFHPMKAPLKAVMCLIGGTAAGLLFDGVAGGFWFWPGLIIGTVLLHFLIEIIYAFDFHAIFKKPLHLLAILAVLLGGCLLLRADVFGYDRYLPAENTIAAADLDTYTAPLLQTPENISAVRRIAALGVEAAQSLPEMESAEQITYDTDNAPRYEHFQISYRLKNGRFVCRSYTIPQTEELLSLRRQITSSTEYMRAKWTLFTFDPAGKTGEETGGIEVITEQGYQTAAEIMDPEQVRQVLDTLREEALTRPETAVPTLQLRLGYQRQDENGTPYVMREGDAIITRADTKTLALIEQFTGVTPQPLSTDDVRAIEIIPNYKSDENWLAEVTDPVDVAQLLKDAVNYDVLSNWNEDVFENSFDKNDEVIVIAITKRGSQSITLYYPLGKTPAALIEAYSETAMREQTEAERQEGTVRAEKAMAW